MINKKQGFGIFVFLLILFVGLFLFPLGRELSSFSLSELLFHLCVPLKGANNSVIWNVLRQCCPVPLIATVISGILLIFPQKSNISIKFSGRLVKNDIYIRPINVLRRNFCWISALVLIAGGFYFSNKMNVVEYFSQLSAKTSLYEQKYVDPAEQEFEYPEEKRNLIFIYMESMESTYADKPSGGEWEYNLIPNLSKMAADNISFGGQNGEGKAGMISPVNSAAWTMGALVGSTAGLPLKLPIDGNSYGDYSFLLPGAVTMNDLLKDAGYNQVFMIGSDGAFGGRSDYFEQHGDVFIFDINEAKRQGLIENDYHNGFWGIEDGLLYDYAKNELLRLAAEGEPFNLTLLTVDTHFFDGYVCPQCETQWDTQYENVISCADRQVMDFVDWVTKQDFFPNTSIVIIGDHLSMDDSFFEQHNIAKDRRGIYNCFINSAVQPVANATARKLTIYDIFPSTLAALGITWDCNCLGLGTNLFSGEGTLIEQMGIDNFNSELGKTSYFYDKRFIYP